VVWGGVAKKRGRRSTASAQASSASTGLCSSAYSQLVGAHWPAIQISFSRMGRSSMKCVSGFNNPMYRRATMPSSVPGSF
jgi:hypothetical protein